MFTAGAPCPQLVDWRWHYQFEVLHWLFPRRKAMACLGVGFITPTQDMTPAERSMLRELVGDSGQAAEFWATCSLLLLLATWGWKVRGWLHGCVCHSPDSPGFAKCRMKGRRAVQLACGKWNDFVCDLQQCDLDDEAHQCMQDLVDRGRGDVAATPPSDAILGAASVGSPDHHAARPD
jgi:hypothetical protein